MAKVTIKDVARAAGVSVTTVSQILNHKKVFPDDTIAKVQQVVKEMGYVADRNARQLRGPKRSQTAVVIPDFTNPFFGSLVTNLRSHLLKLDAEMDLSIITANSKGLTSTVEEVINRGFEGIIIADTSTNIKMLNENLIKIKLPFVLLDRAEIKEAQHSVLVDDYLGGQMAAEHLFNLGHRNASLIVPDFFVDNLVIRQKGFVEFWEKHTDTSLQIVTVPLSKDGGKNAAKEISSNSTAVFALNDQLAIGLLRGLYEQHVRVPEDISVVGYDGIDDTKYTFPSLTTVSQPLDELSEQAIIKLLNQFNAQQIPEGNNILSPKLTIRESTKKL